MMAWRFDEAVSTIASMPESALVTYEDLASFADDNVRREIIDGELFVTAAPFLRHQRVLRRLLLAFDRHIQEHGGGEVFMAPADVVFSQINVVEPDLLFIAKDQLEIMTEKNVQGAPALIAEVVSDSRMDRVRKRDLYARFGVPEYWVVDPDADRVEVYRLDDGSYPKPQLFEPGDVLAYARLPGLQVDVAALFAR